MRTMVIATTCVLLATPVLAQSVGQQAKDLGEKTGVNSVIGAAPTTADFVNEAAIGDMFEIKSAELAAQRADPATKSFAGQMVKDHTKASRELKSAATAENLVLPVGMDSKHQKMLDDLRSKSGADFTKAYLEDQVDAHETAVSLFDRYARNGTDPALKAWAAKTLPELQQHLAMAKSLNKT